MFINTDLIINKIKNCKNIWILIDEVYISRCFCLSLKFKLN